MAQTQCPLRLLQRQWGMWSQGRSPRLKNSSGKSAQSTNTLLRWPRDPYWRSCGRYQRDTPHESSRAHQGRTVGISRRRHCFAYSALIAPYLEMEKTPTRRCSSRKARHLRSISKCWSTTDSHPCPSRDYRLVSATQMTLQRPNAALRGRYNWNFWIANRWELLKKGCGMATCLFEC